MGDITLPSAAKSVLFAFGPMALKGPHKMLADQTKQTGRKAPTKAPAIVVIGVGNEFRRDDAAGLLVARALKAQVGQKLDNGKVSVLECTGGSFELMDDWDGAGIAIIVDAVVSGADPGTVLRIDANEQPVPNQLFRYSSHGFSIAETIELARLLGKLPPKVIIFGIEGADFGQGPGLSDEMAFAVERVTRSVLDYVRNCTEETES
jgi:hydrogenase maturation protease